MIQYTKMHLLSRKIIILVFDKVKPDNIKKFFHRNLQYKMTHRDYISSVHCHTTPNTR